MTPNSTHQGQANPPGWARWQRMLTWPHTPFGWASILLAAAFSVVAVMNICACPASWDQRDALLATYSVLMPVFALSAGVTGAVALARQRDRSVLVWVAALLGVLVLANLIAGVFG